MTNIPFRSHTRSISIAAPPGTVLEYLGDGENLPEWAPDFAAGVEHQDGDRWLITSGEVRFPILLPVRREAGTVDFVAGEEPRIGAFARVLANGEGSEFMFTLMLPAGA